MRLQLHSCFLHVAEHNLLVIAKYIVNWVPFQRCVSQEKNPAGEAVNLSGVTVLMRYVTKI